MSWDFLPDLLKNVGTFVGGFLTLWLSQKAANRNAKANEQTTALDIALQPLKESNAAWQAINGPLISRIAALEENRERDESRITRLEQDYGVALKLLISWAEWILGGALPPPPEIPPWLSQHLSGKARNDEPNPPAKE